MRTTLVPGFIIVLAAAASLATSAPGGAATTGCEAGISTFGGATARIFCGPATATVHAGGKTFTIRQGLCQKTAGSLTVNLGEIVIGSSTKPKPEYFGLTVGREAVGTGSAAGRD